MPVQARREEVTALGSAFERHQEIGFPTRRNVRPREAGRPPRQVLEVRVCEAVGRIPQVHLRAPHHVSSDEAEHSVEHTNVTATSSLLHGFGKTATKEDATAATVPAGEKQ